MKAFQLISAGLLLTTAMTASAQAPGPFGQNQDGDAYEVIERLAQAVVAAQAPRPRTPASQPDRPMTDLVALLERLSDELGKEFIVPPYLSADALGWSTLDADADFETLQGLLRTSQMTTFETADQIFIVQDATARAQPSQVLNEDDRRVSDHEIVTRLVDVENIPCARLIPILRPMMPQAAQLTCVQGTSTIILVDRYDNIRRLTAIIRGIDEAAEG